MLSSPLVASILSSAPAQLPYSSAYHSSVQLCYHRLSLLTTRLLTDYLTKTQAGQLVALEHVDGVVVSMVNSYASLRLQLFVCDMDVIVPLFGELAEWGSLNVRGAVRRWIQGKGLRMMRLAVARAQHEHEIDQLIDEDDDDDDGEGEGEGDVNHGGARTSEQHYNQPVMEAEKADAAAENEQRFQGEQQKQTTGSTNSSNDHRQPASQAASASSGAEQQTIDR